MSATVAAALKKIAVALLTDKKGLKTVGGIVLGVLVIIIMPIIAVVSIFNGSMQFYGSHWRQALPNLADEPEEVEADEPELDEADPFYFSEGMHL